MNSYKPLWVAVTLYVLIGCTLSHAAPAEITYQGKIETPDGDFTGTGYFRFAIMSSDGTVQYWSNDGANPPAENELVQVTNGLFSVILGENTVMEPLPESVFTDDDVALKIWFGDAVGTIQLLTPNQPLTSTAFALQSENSALLENNNGDYYLDWGNLINVPLGFSDDDDDDQPDDDSEVPDDISINNGNLYSISGSGNVGIGRTNPSEKLDVNGKIISSHGVVITDAAEDGLHINNAGDQGIYISNAGDEGIHIHDTDNDGIMIYEAGTLNTFNTDPNHNGIEIAGTEGHGIFLGHNEMSGVVVNDAVANGLLVNNANSNGLLVSNANSSGVRINQASVGINVKQAEVAGVSVYQSNGDGLTLNNIQGTGILMNLIHDYGINLSHSDRTAFYIGYSGGDGIAGQIINNSGIQFNSCGDDGVNVGEVGSPSSNHSAYYSVGFEVSGSSGDGVYIGHADQVGVNVASAAGDGILVDTTESNGLTINDAGTNGVNIQNVTDTGVMIANAGNRGITVTQSAGDGIFIEKAGSGPAALTSTSSNGIEIGSTQNYGIYLGATGSDGLYIRNAGDEGVYIRESVDDALYVYDTGDCGLFINQATDAGIDVEAERDGVVTSTTNSSSYYGVNTDDTIYAAGGYLPAQMKSFCVNNGDTVLKAGDIVSIAGDYLSVDLEMGADPMALPGIELTHEKNAQAVFGVVVERAEISENYREISDTETKLRRTIRTAKGVIKPGDLLTVVVMGPADVRVDTTADPIISGDSLVAGDSAAARRIHTTEINGLIIAENTGILGKAMENADGKAWVKVFVSPR